MTQRSETRDGMRIDWDVPITMDDGAGPARRRFPPDQGRQHPVILTYGPYAKGLAFQDGYPSAWQRMVEKHPDVAAGSSNIYQSWEVVDPEKWVPHGYACVRVDSRGAGCSPGFIDHFSPRETKDFYDCIEWAGVQPWSNGKVGLNGISYYGINAVARRVAAAAAPRRDVRLGGRGRLVSRHDASRRHALHLLGELVRHAGEDRAVRRGRARQALARARRTRLRAGDAQRGATCEEPLRLRRGDPRASARRRLSQGALARVGQDHGAAVLGRELGRTGPASARQFRRVHARRLERKVAGGARHRALDAFLYRLRPRAAAQVLRLFPEGRGHRLGQAAARAVAGAPSGRKVRRARRE